MKGRERVKAAITFNKPYRIPRDLWALPYIILFRKDELDSILSKYPMDIGLSEISLNFTEEQLLLTAKKVNIPMIGEVVGMLVSLVFGER